MTKLNAAGHPIHPLLITLPIGGLAFSCAMDWLHLATGKRRFRDAGFYGLVFGVAGAGLAALTGLGDYLSVPSHSEEKRVANAHALLNVGITGLYLTELWQRRKNRLSPGATAAFSTSGVAALMVSGWYGGDLVYEHGVRVRGRRELPGKTWSLPGDERVARALHSAAEVAPEAGPMLQ